MNKISHPTRVDISQKKARRHEITVLTKVEIILQKVRVLITALGPFAPGQHPVGEKEIRKEQKRKNKKRNPKLVSNGLD